MGKMYVQVVLWIVFAIHGVALAKPAEINQYDVTYKMQEIMRAHAVYKTMSPVLAKRSLDNFINLLDPYKTYFLEGEISKWINPTNELLEQVTKDFEYSKFPAFEEIFNLMQPCIDRRNRFEDRLKNETMPSPHQNFPFG